jgi:hypothetical protein
MAKRKSLKPEHCEIRPIHALTCDETGALVWQTGSWELVLRTEDEDSFMDGDIFLSMTPEAMRMIHRLLGVALSQEEIFGKETPYPPPVEQTEELTPTHETPKAAVGKFDTRPR